MFPGLLLAMGIYATIFWFINSILNKEYVSQSWKESIIELFKKGDETSHSNNGGTSFLSSSDKVLSSILLPRLISYVDEITGAHEWISIFHWIFYNHWILEEK
jgi:hypothetical protein